MRVLAAADEDGKRRIEEEALSWLWRKRVAPRETDDPSSSVLDWVWMSMWRECRRLLDSLGWREGPGGDVG